MEEIKLQKIEKNLRMYENNLKELKNVELSMGTKDEEIDAKIK